MVYNAQSSSKIVRKKFVYNLLLILISFAFFISIGELCLRLPWVNHWLGLSYYKRFPQGLVCQPHDIFGWIGRPNESGTISFNSVEKMNNMDILMNSEGFWDEEHQTIKPPGIKRVIFLGDSFTAGYGIQAEDRFTEVIEKKLPSHYEAINMGMWGYSTDQELLLLDEKGLSYSPDIVIVALFLDDLFNCNLFSVNDGIYLKPKFVLSSNNTLKLRNVPVPNNRSKSCMFNLFVTRYSRLRNRLEMGSEFIQKGWISIFDMKYLRRKGYSLTLRLISEIEALCHKNQVKFLLVLIPYKAQFIDKEVYAGGEGYNGIPHQRLDISLPQKVIRLFCEESEIPVFDLLPSFKKYPQWQKLFFEKDLHWTKEGHKYAAEEIYRHLKDSGYLR